ncbi:hypothetical protein [Streptomyces sp. NPDC050560]|uniref:hypothetical protein n=1 Tax=Streptomyces sp. NPDC050560 TaxID=3365630 RepID=UPI0037B3A9FA
MPTRHNHDDERDLLDTYATSVTREIGAPVMNWTQYAGHGPGWENLLLRAGFLTAEVRILGAPQPDHIGTLIGRAMAN